MRNGPLSVLRKNGLLIFHYEKSFPNPFHKKVNIKIVLGREEAVVALMIYDVGGRLVKSFPPFHSKLPAVITWDGKDDSDHRCPDGIYFIHLVTTKTPQH